MVKSAKTNWEKDSPFYHDMMDVEHANSRPREIALMSRTLLIAKLGNEMSRFVFVYEYTSS